MNLLVAMNVTSLHPDPAGNVFACLQSKDGQSNARLLLPTNRHGAFRQGVTLNVIVSDEQPSGDLPEPTPAAPTAPLPSNPEPSKAKVAVPAPKPAKAPSRKVAVVKPVKPAVKKKR
jgi:hypothetical protein